MDEPAERYTPAQWVIRQIGGQPRTHRSRVYTGVSAVARALGINTSQVCRWGDTVPTAHQARVLEIAEERGLDITAEDLIRGRAVCPGQRLHDSLVHPLIDRAESMIERQAAQPVADG